jgi:aminoglycoside phosphotransferase (APT) family kinase protein
MALAVNVAHDADVTPAVRAYASAVVPGCSPERITEVRRLPPGENHDAYAVSLVVDDPMEVVVRIATSERARDCPTAEREAHVLKLVRGVSAPVLYDFRCASDWFDVPTMCMQLVAGNQRPPRSDAEAMRLGEVVGGLHALGIEDFAGWPDATIALQPYLNARIAKIDGRLPLVRDPLPTDAQLRLRQARSLLDKSLGTPQVREAFQSRDALVLLHGDVAGGNIVWTPAPFLIDWEYARVGDPADEIAYILNQNDLSDELRRRFWRGYERILAGDGSSGLRERVRCWEPVTVLGSAFFWVELWARRARADEAGRTDSRAPKEQAYYRDHTMRRLERAELLLQGFTV